MTLVLYAWICFRVPGIYTALKRFSSKSLPCIVLEYLEFTQLSNQKDYLTAVELVLEYLEFTQLSNG